MTQHFLDAMSSPSFLSQIHTCIPVHPMYMSSFPLYSQIRLWRLPRYRKAVAILSSIDQHTYSKLWIQSVSILRVDVWPVTELESHSFVNVAFVCTTSVPMHDYLHVYWLSCIAGGLGLSCLFRSYAVEIGTGDCVFLSGTGTGKAQTHVLLAWHCPMNCSISSACTPTTHQDCIKNLV